MTSDNLLGMWNIPPRDWNITNIGNDCLNVQLTEVKNQVYIFQEKKTIKKYTTAEWKSARKTEDREKLGTETYTFVDLKNS